MKILGCDHYSSSRYVRYIFIRLIASIKSMGSVGRDKVDLSSRGRKLYWATYNPSKSIWIWQRIEHMEVKDPYRQYQLIREMFGHGTLALLIKRCGSLTLGVDFVRILVYSLRDLYVIRKCRELLFCLKKQNLIFGLRLVQMEWNYWQFMWPTPTSLSFRHNCCFFVIVCLIANMKSGQGSEWNRRSQNMLHLDWTKKKHTNKESKTSMLNFRMWYNLIDMGKHNRLFSCFQISLEELSLMKDCHKLTVDWWIPCYHW